jgi:hypothetical protein
MKAITLWPEWAHAIVHLGKRVENRDWRPPASLIGQRIAIHAGKSIGGRPGAASVREGVASLHRACPYSIVTEIMPDHREVAIGSVWHPVRGVETSCILATAILGEPVESAEAEGERAPDIARPEWAAWGDLRSRFWWPLLDVRRVAIPVPCGGKQGFWAVPEDVVARMGVAP